MSQLFKSYEIVRVPYWPKIARIVGPSVVFHVILLASVFYIPAVRDAINVGGIFSEAKFVDKSYKKTTFGDDVDIVDLSPEDQFQYPEGYFSTTDPLPDPMAPVIIEQAAPMPMPMPMPTPWPTPAPVQMPKPLPIPANAPGFPAGINPNGRMVARGKNGKNPAGIPDDIKPAPDPTATPAPTPSDSTAANKQLDQTSQDNNINRMRDDEINRAPLKDFVAEANDMLEKGQLDFSKPIEVTIDTDLDQNAHFVNPKVVSESGNAKLDGISKDMVAALSDSNALQFLMTKDKHSVELTKMRFIIKIDQDNFSAQIETEAPTEERARQMANGYSAMLFLVPYARSGKDDEIAIAKGTTIRSDGKKLIANFSLPRQQAIDLMKKQVAENKKPDS